MATPVLMTAKPVTEKLYATMRADAERFENERGHKPCLAVILVGDDPASKIYTSNKTETAKKTGFSSQLHVFPGSATPSQVQAKVNSLNADPTVHGILIQSPLPPSFDSRDTLTWVLPEKDVDAFHPINAGYLIKNLPSLRPCTPLGIMALLKHYGIETEGRIAAVVGRSHLVGTPVATLLTHADATVIQCHSKTRDLAKLTSLADILVVAAGRPGLIGKNHVKPNAVVIDVGIHRGSDGKIRGDVAFDEVAPLCSAITPVPGGVGPMTIAMVLQNTLIAAKSQASIKKGGGLFWPFLSLKGCRK